MPFCFLHFTALSRSWHRFSRCAGACGSSPHMPAFAVSPPRCRLACTRTYVRASSLCWVTLSSLTTAFLTTSVAPVPCAAARLFHLLRAAHTCMTPAYHFIYAIALALTPAHLFTTAPLPLPVRASRTCCTAHHTRATSTAGTRACLHYHTRRCTPAACLLLGGVRRCRLFLWGGGGGTRCLPALPLPTLPPPCPTLHATSSPLYLYTHLSFYLLCHLLMLLTTLTLLRYHCAPYSTCHFCWNWEVFLLTAASRACTRRTIATTNHMQHLLPAFALPGLLHTVAPLLRRYTTPLMLSTIFHI